MKKNKTVRTMVLDYVENNGPQSWTNLHKVVLTAASQPLWRKNYGSSYLDQVSYSSVCFPTKNEKRYLVRCADPHKKKSKIIDEKFASLNLLLYLCINKKKQQV